MPTVATDETPKFALVLPARISVLDLTNVLLTAIESGIHGIQHWCPKVRLRGAEREFRDQDIIATAMRDGETWNEYICRNVAMGGTLTFFEDEDDTGEGTKPHVMTREKLLEGISRSTLYRHFDPDGLDGPASDIIVQCALLGGVVYC